MYIYIYIYIYISLENSMSYLWVCFFAFQQSVLKTFAGLGFLRSKFVICMNIQYNMHN